MLCRVYKKLALFSLWATLFGVALPVFAQVSTAVSTSGSNPAVQGLTAPATGSNATSWTPANWIALITALGGVIVSIVGALKGMAAQKTADVNTSRLNDHEGRIKDASNAGASAQSKTDAHGERLNAIANRLNEHGTQITNLAQNQMPTALLSSLMSRLPQ